MHKSCLLKSCDTAKRLLAKIKEKHFALYKCWAQKQCDSSLDQCTDESEETPCDISLDDDFKILLDVDMEAEESFYYNSDMHKDANAVV